MYKTILDFSYNIKRLVYLCILCILYILLKDCYTASKATSYCNNKSITLKLIDSYLKADNYNLYPIAIVHDTPSIDSLYGCIILFPLHHPIKPQFGITHNIINQQLQDLVNKIGVNNQLGNMTTTNTTVLSTVTNANKHVYSAIPQEFLQLSNQPRVLLVDVFLLGRSLGSTYIIKKGKWLSFKNPQQLAALITNLTDEQLFIKNIPKKLAANTHKVCKEKSTRFCGNLGKVEHMGVIYDSNSFRLDLFINTKYLDNPFNNNPRHLELPTTGFSYRIYANNSMYKTDANKLIYASNLNNIVAYNENMLFSNISFTQDTTSLKSLYFTKQIQDKQYTGLFFESTHWRMLPQQSIFGVSMSKLLTTRTNRDTAYTTPISLLLAVDSIVSIYKDEVLLHNKFYPAGYQQISGAFLPQGAYEVDIEIEDEYGNIVNQQQFVVKSNSLPPLDTLLYWLDAGCLADLQSSNYGITDIHFIRAGAAKRIANYNALSINMLSAANYLLLETNLDYELDNMSSSASFIISNYNDFGVQANFNARLHNTSISSSLHYIQANTRQDLLFNPFLNDTFNANFNINFNFNKISLSFPYQFSKNTRYNNQTENYGMRFNYFIWNNAKFNASMQGNLTYSNNIRQAKISLNLSSRINEQVQINSNSYYNLENNKIDNNTGLAWSAYDTDNNPFRGNLGYSYYNNKTDSGSEYNLSTQYANYRGRYNYEYQRNYNGTGRHSGNFNFNLVGNQDTIAIGGKQNAQSGIIVQTRAVADNIHFEILVNNKSYGVYPANTNIPLMLPSYHEYKIQLVPVGDNNYGFHTDSKTRNIVLYPGNFAVISWDIQQTAIILGRLLDANNKPIANAFIQNPVSYAITNRFGFFQITSYVGKDILVKLPDKSQCTIKFPQQYITKNVINLGIAKCIAENPSNKP